MELIRINEVVNTFNLSSRTLRYYEQVGLIWSTHPDNKMQRYYEPAALERLKQIIILRKLQIPIKDIVAIYQNTNTTTLIQAFTNKLESLDMDISALSELRVLVDDFLQKMLSQGVKKISSITLLYEETEKRLATANEDELVTFEKLSQINSEVLKLHDVRMVRLPTMRFLTSRLKTGQVVTIENNMQDLFKEYGFTPHPGLRDCFFRKDINGDWIMLMKIPEAYENTTEYVDETFTGGLFAITCSFFEDMDDKFNLLKDWINNSTLFKCDMSPNSNSCRYEMIEEILPWDIANQINRYQQDLFVPIKIDSKKNLSQSQPKEEKR